jgi:DNA-binding response OmpR family regulator
MNEAMIIDDDEDYRSLLVRKLSRSYPRINIHEIDPLTMPLPDEKFSWDKLDFIILDYQLGIDYTGLDWFKRFKSENMPATILLTARGSEELAVKAIKLGIDDYIVKEHFDNDKLTDSINECVYKKKHERAKMLDLTTRSTVFNKSSFIHKLVYN